MSEKFSRKSLILGGVAGVAAITMGPGVAQAAPSLAEARRQIEAALPSRLTVKARELGLSNVFDSFSFPLTAAIWSDYGSSVELIVSAVVSDYFSEARSVESAAPVITTYGSGSYVAVVGAAIPALGAAYVKQEFTAVCTNGIVSGARAVGHSYMSGAAIGSWNPDRTEFTYGVNHKSLNVTMIGELYYLWKGITLGGRQRFLDTWTGQGGRLVS